MKRFLCVILVVGVGLLSGCARTKQAAVAKVSPSGFLSEELCAKMSEGNREEFESALRYHNPRADWKKYDKILLDPIVLFAPERKAEEGLDPEDVQKIVDYMYSKLYMAIEDGPYMSHATKPGPNTVRFQFAITTLEESNVTMDTVSTYIPQPRLLTTVVTFNRDKPAFTGQIGIEFKLTDAKTGHVLVAGLDRRYGGKTWGKEIDSWGDVRAIIDLYVQILGYRTCRLQERPNCVRPEV